MRKLTIAAVFLAAAGSLAACGGAAPAAATPTTPAGATAAGVKAPGEAKVGDHTVCPVSGEAFVVTDASPKVVHEGKTYYFCCPGCDKKFEANPQGFIKKPAA